ncbi:KA1 domain-containing protein [Trichostrongylus colubriformis]|uniref:Hydroxylysine kinase n=1 Tax=Trichostrongylus colubriformis TaxID=6319 RepID=A0AAN8FFU5_TRICO
MEPYSYDEITQAPIPEPYHLHHLLKMSYGINQAALKELTGYDDCNFLLNDVIWETAGAGPSQAILKVSNPLEAKCDQNIDFQVKICQILSEKGINCPKTIRRLDGREWGREEIVDGVYLPVRLFEVIPGSNLENFTYDPDIVEEIGEVLARFHMIADQSKLSVSHVPYIAVEHRRGILKELELLLDRSIISKDNAKLISECLAEFDNGIAKHSEMHEIGMLLCKRIVLLQQIFF